MTCLELHNYKHSRHVHAVALRCKKKEIEAALATTRVRLLAQNDQPRNPGPGNQGSTLLSGKDFLEKRIRCAVKPHAWNHCDGGLLKVLPKLVPAVFDPNRRRRPTLAKLVQASLQQAFVIGPYALRPQAFSSSSLQADLCCLTDMIPLEFFEVHDDNVVNQILLGVIRCFWTYLNNRIHGAYFIPAEAYSRGKVPGSALTDPAAQPSSWPKLSRASTNGYSKDQPSLSAPNACPASEAKDQRRSNAEVSETQSLSTTGASGGKGLLLPQSADTDITIESEDESEPSVTEKGGNVNQSENSLNTSQEEAASSKKGEKHAKPATDSDDSLPDPEEQAASPNLKKSHSKSSAEPTQNSLTCLEQTMPASHSKDRSDSNPLLGSAKAAIVVDAPEDLDNSLIKRELSPLFLPNDATYSGGLRAPKKPRKKSLFGSVLRSISKTAKQMKPSNGSSRSAEARQVPEMEQDEPSESEEEESSDSEQSESDAEDLSASNRIKCPSQKRKRLQEPHDPSKRQNRTVVTEKPSVATSIIVPEINRTPSHPHSSACQFPAVDSASKKPAATIEPYAEDSTSDEDESMALAPVKKPEPREKIVNKAGKLQQKPIQQGDVYQRLYIKERTKTSHYETILKEVGITESMLSEMVQRLELGSTPGNAVNTVKAAYKRNNG